MMNRGAHNLSIAATILDQLVAAGVEDLVLSPGFRNSPLILASQSDSRLRTHTVLDERSAAFFALGLAKAKQKPAAFACTSGTAAGNYFPAILEASYSQVPLIAITADRPAEILGLGENQTMNQVELFGPQVRQSVTISTRSISHFDFDWLRHVVGKTAFSASFPNPGPVHINISFEEPLLPKVLDDALKPKGRAKNFIPPRAIAAPDAFTKILAGDLETIFVLGNADFSAEALDSFLYASEKLGALLLAEPSSGILGRESSVNSSVLLSRFDELIALPPERVPVRRILRFGPPPVHKRLPIFLGSLESAQHFVFDFPTEARDPILGESTYYTGSPNDWALALREYCAEKPARKISKFVAEAQAQASAAQKKWLGALAEKSSGSEFHAIKFILDSMPKQSSLFLGNSLPIRDFNTLARGAPRYSKIFHNRGLSGIDGLIATASGVACAENKMAVLILGDLSAQHDIGSLTLAARLIQPAALKIIVLNNGGGSIFRGLPLPEGNMEWFTTPQKIDFSHAAAAFSLAFTRLEPVSAAEKILAQSFASPDSEMIEFMIPPDARLSLR